MTALERRVWREGAVLVAVIGMAVMLLTHCGWA